MADNPTTELQFNYGCADCGNRTPVLPGPLPVVGDDFDWSTRDYDGFRAFMLEELAARFPERTTWTPGDLEVVLVEIFSAALDQLSDAADRIAAEGYLETARQPQSVRKLLAMIGYDAVDEAASLGLIAPGAGTAELDQFWASNPVAMAQAKIDGPLKIFDQDRMVTQDDYGTVLQNHPLVLQAAAWAQWGGSWSVINVAVLCYDELVLDDRCNSADVVPLQPSIQSFNEEQGLALPDWNTATIRSVLMALVDESRMVGQEVVLVDVEQVGIFVSLTILVGAQYYQTEVQSAVLQALGVDPTGLFRPGNYRLGQSVYSSDIYKALMPLDGVESVCLNTFKIVGDGYPNQAAEGSITVREHQVAVCKNDPSDPTQGYLRLRLSGGRKL